MQSTKKHQHLRINNLHIGSEKGFVLVVAILGIAILLAVGVLALTMSGQDIRIAGRVVGGKKAFFACESGIHRLITNFDPEDLSGNAKTDEVVDASVDPASVYTIGTPAHPSTGPGMLPLAGYSIGGGQVWGQTVYNATVTGENTNYNSRVRISVGMGYGPTEMTTISR
jgi:hypothetical protein